MLNFNAQVLLLILYASSRYIGAAEKLFNQSLLLEKINSGFPEFGKPLALNEIRWKNYYEDLQATHMWPHSWLRLVNTKHPLTNYNQDEDEVRLAQLELFIYNWPNLEGGRTCISHFHSLGQLCEYEQIRHIAAMYLTQSFRKYLTWQQPDQYAILEAKGLLELSSVIYHFYKCVNGVKGHCVNPCKHISPCRSIDNTNPGACIVVDPSGTRGLPGMKFNAAWAFMSVKCECAAGHRWDELQGLCVKSSLCYIHSPCFHNGTERCDDIDVEDFKCTCKHGYSGTYCDQVNMCVTEHLCEPHGQCSKVKGRSSQLGHVYRCNCSEGYRDDPTSPVPDCTVFKQSLFAYRDYTPPFVYYVIVGCCVVSIMLAYFIVHMEKRRKRPGKLNQKRLKREKLREHLEKKQRSQSSSGQSETGT